MTKKTDQELVKLLTDTRVELRKERFAAAGTRAKNPSKMKEQRATIARVLTEQRARALKAQTA